MKVVSILALAAVTGFLATQVAHYMLPAIVDVGLRLSTDDQITRQTWAMFFLAYDVGSKIDICVSAIAAAGFALLFDVDTSSVVGSRRRKVSGFSSFLPPPNYRHDFPATGTE